MENRGFEPLLQPSESIDVDTTELIQNDKNSKQINVLPNSQSSAEKQTQTFPEHPNYTSAHKKCVTCVHQDEITIPDDLQEIIDRWNYLPNAIKAGIMAMVRAT